MSMDSGDCETEEDSAPEACVSPEGPLLPSNSRDQRNRAEKMRRDKLNSHIGELATLVPMVSGSAKRMDKTSILRLTATYLRIYHTLLSGRNNQNNLQANTQTDILLKVDPLLLEQLVLEQLGGFLLVLTTMGKIVFVSHTVEQLLGHLQTDLMGQSIFNITLPDDHERLRTHLSPEVTEPEWRKYFNVQLARASSRSETPTYEAVSVMGMFRPTGNATRNAITRCRDTNNSTANNDVLVVFVRLFRSEPLTDRLIEASKDEYVTRHLVDGRIINCDQRISFVAGYMTEEVSGLSAFNFMHKEDVRWVMIALRQMYDRGDSRGWSCYRLQSKTGQFIYLRTCGYLETDESGAVGSFICVNSLVTENEGVHLIKEMKARYSALIKTTPAQLTDSEMSLASVEDPKQLEVAIMHLITNLPTVESRSSPSPPQRSSPAFENQDCVPAAAATTPNPPPPPPPLPAPRNAIRNKTAVSCTTTTTNTNTTQHHHHHHQHHKSKRSSAVLSEDQHHNSTGSIGGRNAMKRLRNAGGVGTAPDASAVVRISSQNAAQCYRASQTPLTELTIHGHQSLSMTTNAAQRQTNTCS